MRVDPLGHRLDRATVLDDGFGALVARGVLIAARDRLVRDDARIVTRSGEDGQTENGENRALVCHGRYADCRDVTARTGRAVPVHRSSTPPELHAAAGDEDDQRHAREKELRAELADRE